MLDADLCWRARAAIVIPGNIARQHVFGPLEPLETDHSSCGGVRMPRCQGAPCECVDVLARGRGFGSLFSAPHRNAFPGIPYRHIADLLALDENARMQPMHHLPGVPADRDDFLRSAGSGCLALANGRIAHLRIELVRGFGRDTRNHPIADADSALAADVAEEMDRALMIWRGACGDALFPIVRS